MQAAINVLTNTNLFSTIVNYQNGLNDFELQLFYLLYLDVTKKDLHSEFNRFHQYLTKYTLPIWMKSFDSVLDCADSQKYHRMRHSLKKLTYYAAAFGNVELLAFLLDKMPIERSPALWEVATKYGQLSILQYLDYNCSTAFCQLAMAHALTVNNVDVVQYLHEYRQVPFSKFSASIAAVNGNLDVVKYVCNKTEQSTRVTVEVVAKNGHLSVLQYLYDNKISHFQNQVMNEAAIAGQLEVVKYLHEGVHLKCSSQALKTTRKNGHNGVADYLSGHQSSIVVQKIDALCQTMKSLFKF
ncbi:hypothetical protein THRCLA_03177 [Thraustotheca clavata]|uniref:Uncharacterized protein n=1 Tax=Thraustotheca clavata TaxID=74557 RepID=A0A1W0A3I9_9STRA|nr:hypothetical protein THRCLA_03177 [Thraustotheca clavata]